MKIRIVIARIDGEDEQQEAERSLASARMSMKNCDLEGEPEVVTSTSIEQAWESAYCDDVDLIHFMRAGTILLPVFYFSARTYLDHTKRDWTYCKMVCSRRGLHIGTPECPLSANWMSDQIVVRRWVMFEIDKPFPENYNIAIAEYRGQEIPSTQCVR